MQPSVAAVRGLWIVLMAVLAGLMLTGTISGVWTALYGAVVLGVMLWEWRLRRI